VIMCKWSGGARVKPLQERAAAVKLRVGKFSVISTTVLENINGVLLTGRSEISRPLKLKRLALVNRTRHPLALVHRTRHPLALVHRTRHPLALVHRTRHPLALVHRTRHPLLAGQGFTQLIRILCTMRDLKMKEERTRKMKEERTRKMKEERTRKMKEEQTRKMRIRKSIKKNKSV